MCGPHFQSMKITEHVSRYACGPTVVRRGCVTGGHGRKSPRGHRSERRGLFEGVRLIEPLKLSGPGEEDALLKYS